jgi:two-component system sensor histidine kinase DesK
MIDPARRRASPVVVNRYTEIPRFAGAARQELAAMDGQMASEESRFPPRDGAAEVVISPAVWQLFTMIWLLFLFYPIRDLLAAHLQPLRLGIALAGMVTFVGIYLWLMLHEPFRDVPLTPSEVRLHFVLIALLSAIVLFLTISYSIDWLWFIMYANMAAAVKLPTRAAAAIITSQTLLTVVVGWVIEDWQIAGRIVSPVAAVAVVMIGISRLIVTIRELRAARQEIARLAVSEERLRFARDVHDLLGHSLSAITLKNELARRLIPTYPERAVAELDDAIAMAREALREVREAVGGYRQPTLSAELRSAREILEAAGIVCRYEDAAGALPPATESILAWTVREGVTNVVRHSRARHCAIRVMRADGMASVEVTDDGVALTAPINGMGNGLRGLAERAAQQGGYSDAGPSATGGFRLHVALPVTGKD